MKSTKPAVDADGGQSQGTLRHRSRVDAAGYTMLVNCVLYDKQLSDGAKLTYMALLDHARQADSCYPGQETLAEKRDLSVRSVRAHLAELEGRGLITVEQRGLRQTNLYWIESIHAVYETDPPRPDRKKTAGQDRKNSAGQERRETAGQDRKNSADKEDAVGSIPSRNKTTTAGEPVAGSLPESAADVAAALDASLLSDLITAGVGRAVAVRLAAQHPDECRRQLAYLPYVTEFRSGPGAYLRAAIEQGFAAPAGYQAEQERQRKAAAKAARATRAQTAGEGTSAAQEALEARQAAICAERERLQREETKTWFALLAAAVGSLPPPIRDRPDGPAYRGALEAAITRLVGERLGRQTE